MKVATAVLQGGVPRHRVVSHLQSHFVKVWILSNLEYLENVFYRRNIRWWRWSQRWGNWWWIASPWRHLQILKYWRYFQILNDIVKILTVCWAVFEIKEIRKKIMVIWQYLQQYRNCSKIRQRLLTHRGRWGGAPGGVGRQRRWRGGQGGAGGGGDAHHTSPVNMSWLMVGCFGRFMNHYK